MTELLLGAYGAAMGGSARGIGRGRTGADGRFELLDPEICYVRKLTRSPAFYHVNDWNGVKDIQAELIDQEDLTEGERSFGSNISANIRCGLRR